MSWQSQDWFDLPILDSALPRLFAEDNHALPFIRDLFDFANTDLDPNDVIIFTNADLCVASDCCNRISSKLETADACYAFRRDFYHDFAAPLTDSAILGGIQYAGCDLFAMRARWWRLHREAMPDLLLGREFWDGALRTLIDRSNRHAAIDGLCYHRRHDSTWEQNGNRRTLPSQQYCISEGKKWCAANGLDYRQFGLGMG